MDPEAEETLSGFVASAAADQRVKRSISSLFSRGTQMEVGVRELMRNFQYSFVKPDDHFAEVMECASNVINLNPAIDKRSVPLSHYTDLILLTSCLTMTAVFVLLWEWKTAAAAVTQETESEAKAPIKTRTSQTQPPDFCRIRQQQKQYLTPSV